MRVLTAAALIAIAAPVDGWCSDPVSTDILALAARHYLFFALPTTRAIVSIPVPEKNAPYFFECGYLQKFSEISIYWPGKTLASSDTAIINQVFAEAYSHVARSAFGNPARDRTVFQLCQPRMGQKLQMQFLLLNEEFMDRLRQHYSDEPRPLGVYLTFRNTGQHFFIYR